MSTSSVRSTAAEGVTRRPTPRLSRREGRPRPIAAALHSGCCLRHSASSRCDRRRRRREDVRCTAMVVLGGCDARRRPRGLGLLRRRASARHAERAELRGTEWGDAACSSTQRYSAPRALARPERGRARARGRGRGKGRAWGTVRCSHRSIPVRRSERKQSGSPPQAGELPRAS